MLKHIELCPDCKKVIEVKGYPIINTLETIVETCFLLQSPIILSYTNDQILDMLERHRYIVTTENMDPSFYGSNSLMVKPQGRFYENSGSLNFCFDNVNHE